MKEQVEKIRGFNKIIENLKIKLFTLVYFTGLLFKGEIKLKHYPRILRRLLFFLASMKHNKYVRINGRTKINLYVPGFPSKAFYTACRKVLEFEKKMPCISVLISLTSACRYKCPHCYQKYDRGKDMGIEVLLNTVKKLQDKGVAFFNIEGGEPFLVFDKLLKVCDAIDDRSEILINSTGDGLTYDKIQALANRNNLLGIMFSLHTDKPDELNDFMGRNDAWNNLSNGIELCHKTGVPVTFNTCLLRDAFFDGTFEDIMEMSKMFQGSILQLIKPKPAGGWLESGADTFSESDLKYIHKKVMQYNLNSHYKDYPFISSMFMEESPEVWGCTAGGTDRFYINAKGDVQPCEFLNISFGNIVTEDFDAIYNNMRTVFEHPSDCLLCERYSKEIFRIKVDNELDSLPLTPQLSEELYKDWDRGCHTEFYKKLKNL
jgi:MoaA/NifB/PqqE/SkfB family radical SAM enzyme